MVELRLLTHALALAEHRSFARAARSLHLSQPALSRSIQGLEQDLGLALFERSRKGIEPTEAGFLLLRRAKALLAHSEDFEREAGILQGGGHTELRISAGPYAAHMVVAPTVARCLRANQSFRFTLAVDNWVKAIRDLGDRLADIAICEMSELDERDLDVRPLQRHRAYVVARRGHPLDGVRAPSLQQILSHPVVLSARLPPRVLGELLPGGKDNFSPAVKCENLAMTKTIVASSDAVSLFPLSVVKDEIAGGALVALDFSPPWMHTCFALVRPRDRALSPVARAFWEAAMEVDEETAAESARMEKLLHSAEPLPGPRSLLPC